MCNILYSELKFCISLSALPPTPAFDKSLSSEFRKQRLMSNASPNKSTDLPVYEFPRTRALRARFADEPWEYQNLLESSVDPLHFKNTVHGVDFSCASPPTERAI